jgi:hypothetical protein
MILSKIIKFTRNNLKIAFQRQNNIKRIINKLILIQRNRLEALDKNQVRMVNIILLVIFHLHILTVQGF